MRTVQKLPAMMLIVLIGVLCSTDISVADVLEDALVGAWLFDENQGGTAADASGNGHDGRYSGCEMGSRQNRNGSRIQR